MRIKSLFTNKYFIGILLILIVISVDVMLHPGMSRVMLPKSFSDTLQPMHPSFRVQPLHIKAKDWVKAVNGFTQLETIDSSVAGFETDVYFDEDSENFFVYHDSSAMSETKLYDMLKKYANKNLQASIWLDFKNLSEKNSIAALQRVQNLQTEFGLKNKLLIESPNIKTLKVFCDAGFYTSYYIPFFNPYDMEPNEISKMVHSIADRVEQYPVSALSGYYFQIPLLAEYFPEANLLTWAESYTYSIVSPVFNADLLSQKQVKIVLYNPKN